MYRPDIDGLRTIAVLPVVLGHAGISGFSGGFVGVDVFFVISGFLITGILLRELEAGNFSLLRFYERRARRILPALFVVLIATLLVGYFILIPNQFSSLSKSTLATLLFASNFWFLRSTGDYFGDAAELAPLLHTWSLAVEEQFYIFFPLILWLLFRKRGNLLLITTLALCALSFALAVIVTNRFPDHSFFLIPTRIWELGLGALLAMGAFKTIKSRAVAEAIALAGAAAIIASIVLIDGQTPFPGVAALPTCLGATVIIWTGMSHQTLVARVLSLRLMVAIGLISYSLYLWHWPPLVFARVITGDLHLDTGLALMLVALAIGLAYLSWRFVEKPFRHSKTGPQFSQAQIFAMSGIGGSLIAGCAAVVIMSGGMPSRVPQDSLSIYNDAIARSEIEQTCMRTSGEICQLGVQGEGPPTHYIWGDSHAAALSPGFDVWFEEQGIAAAGAAKTGCPPLLGVVRLDRNSNHNCDLFNQATLDYIAATPSITDVILIGRWALAANGSRAAGESGQPLVLGVSSLVTDAPDGMDNAEIFSFGFQRTVDSLTELGKNITIVQGTPEIGFNVPNSFLQGALLGGQPSAAPTRQAYEERHALSDSIMANALETTPVRLVNVSDLFCPDQCLTEIDGKPLYRDGHHLTIWGAQWFVTSAFGGEAPL